MIVPAHVLGAESQTAPSNKINLACIGVSGMGGADIGGLAPHCNIVALCDVDEHHAAGTFAKFPAAKRFKDFRKMFDEASASFDAVLVATPDHCHAVAAMAAIKHGKHVYCEKPLAHSVGELRALMKAAREAKVVTQLGNQGHSFGTIRDFVEWVQAGAIGQVHTIYAGCNSVNSGLAQLPQLKNSTPFRRPSIGTCGSVRPNPVPIIPPISPLPGAGGHPSATGPSATGCATWWTLFSGRWTWACRRPS